MSRVSPLSADKLYIELSALIASSRQRLPVQQLPSLESQAEKPHRQGLARVIDFAIGLELEVGEVLPVVNDQKIFLDFTSGFVNVKTGATTDHLPELDLAEDRFGKHQVLNGWNVNTSVEHVIGARVMWSSALPRKLTWRRPSRSLLRPMKGLFPLSRASSLRLRTQAPRTPAARARRWFRATCPHCRLCVHPRAGLG